MNASSVVMKRDCEVNHPSGIAARGSRGPFRGYWRAQAGLYRPSCGSLGALHRQVDQDPQLREVAGSHRQRQQLVDLTQSLHQHLAHRADHLGQAEALLDARPVALADLVARVPRGAPIDGVAGVVVEVLRDVRRDVDLAARPGEAGGVLRLVGAQGGPSARFGDVGQHLRGDVALGCHLKRREIACSSRRVTLKGVPAIDRIASSQ